MQLRTPFLRVFSRDVRRDSHNSLGIHMIHGRRWNSRNHMQRMHVVAWASDVLYGPLSHLFTSGRGINSDHDVAALHSLQMLLALLNFINRSKLQRHFHAHHHGNVRVMQSGCKTLNHPGAGNGSMLNLACIQVTATAAGLIS